MDNKTFRINKAILMVINGTDSSEFLTGTVEDDEINGLAGDDFILDKGINNGFFTDVERLIEDDDVLLGGLGNDTLVSGIGNDTLEGGLDSDIFVPNAFDNNKRRDNFTTTIVDFSSQEGDLIDVSDLNYITELAPREIPFNSYGISEFETIEALAEFNELGVNLVFNFNGDENITTLVGVNELSEEDFVFSEVDQDDEIRVGFTNSDHFSGLGNDVIIDAPGVPSSRPPIDDRLFGEGGDDTFYLGYGNDLVYGGDDVDTVYLIGEGSDYEITSTQPGIVTVASLSDTNTLYDVENIGFINEADLSDLFYDNISTEDLLIETIPLNASEQNDSQLLPTPDEVAETERKESQPSAQPTDGDDVLTGTNDDDFVVGSVGDDIGIGLAGNDEYFWENKPENSGGSFTVEDTEGDLDIVNIIDEDLSQTIVTRDGDDIVLTLSGGSTVILTDQFSDPQFEQVRFNFETVLTPQDLIDRIEI